MEEVQQAQPTPQFAQEPAPNATAALVLGILSIVGCCCYAIPGLVMGIIGMVLAKKSIAEYEANPDNYTEGSYKNAKAGKICALIGVILSAIYVLILIVYVAVLIASPELLEQYEDYNTF